jgi:hypothetical protein
MSDPAEDDVYGPPGWLNWQALRAGQPARVDARSQAPLIKPLWQEHALYSDAWFRGRLVFGPYQLTLAFPPLPPTLGTAQLQLSLRAVDHLLDAPVEAKLEPSDANVYVGGDLGDELAALLSLASGRRLRNGGVTRTCFEVGDAGQPVGHLPPVLHRPRHATMLPGIADDATLDDAHALLEVYGQLGSQDAVAVARAAGQYADALWWADADPRIAWIKLVGALETAANRLSVGQTADALTLLKRHRGKLYGLLKRKHGIGAAQTVADELAHTFAAEARFVDFVLTFQPSPPAQRPTNARVDFDHLAEALTIIYDHRSRDLHDGIPFPPPLCEPPTSDGAAPCERFPAISASVGWTTWVADSLPMYLHVFAYIAGGALRNWWSSLTPRA